MRRRGAIRFLVVVGVMALGLACAATKGRVGNQVKAGIPPRWATPHVDGAHCAVDEGAVGEILSRMTLREKVAQMFLVGPAALPLWTPPHARRLVAGLGIGGVFLQPVKSISPGGAEKTASVVRRLQTLALSRPVPIPLLFALDQEGGIPQAFQSLFGGTDGPGNLALAAAGDLEATRAAYRVMGREIRAVGATLALAPTLDRMTGPMLRPMYTRTFGQPTETVAAHAVAAVQGFQEEGVAACIKHFPGGGGAIDDPHHSRPVTHETEAELRASHLPPFVAALGAGADAVMIGQIRFAAWDERFPAAFSRPIKLGLLRGELGFDGVMVSDDLDMGAITGRANLADRKTPPLDWGEDVNVLAIQTGSDLLLYVDGVDDGRIAAMVDRVVRAVTEGRLTEDRIDQSVRRILRLKQEYCVFTDPLPDPARVRTVVGAETNRRTMKRAIARGITLVRNDAGLLPLDRRSGKKILVVSPMQFMLRDPGSTFANATGTTLGKEIAALAEGVETVHYMPGGLEFLMERAAGRVRRSGADLVILALCNGHYDPPQIHMAREIIAAGKPTVVVSLATPYELLDLPEATTFLAVYNYRTLALQTAAETLFGLHAPEGRLPVELPGLYPVGHAAAW